MTVETAKTLFAGSTGKWAGEQLLRAMEQGKKFNTKALRTGATLRRDEWIHLDDALVEEGMLVLAGVADLKAAGLTTDVPNALGKTLFEYEKVTDMDPADVTLGGESRSNNDRQEFDPAFLPMPITHKDFFIGLRTLSGSRERGESLDTTQIRTAGRKCSEEAEKMLFQGGRKFGANTIYGYTDHPDRNTVSFITNGDWGQAAKTGEDILADVLLMMGAAQADGFNGPYWIYLPRGAASTKLEEDFKTNSDKTIRQRLMEVDGIRGVKSVDMMPAAEVVLVQATSDVVVWVQGVPLQTVQWDIQGGFLVNFKAFQIEVPLVRSTSSGDSGVVHMT